MRMALLSDIHGNSVALDAVLGDIAAQGGVEVLWVLGDLVAHGPDPVGVLDRLQHMSNVRCTRGNTDRYVTTGDRPAPSLADVRVNLDLLPTLVEAAGSFAWTQGALSGAGQSEWLAALPLELRERLPDGTRLLGVHAAPGLDDGPGLRPELSDDTLDATLAEAAADLLCVGHTHWPMDRTVRRGRVVNLGSVSNPLAPDLRASYALLRADAAGYQLELRRVEYDRAAVIAALEGQRRPGADFVIRHLRGEESFHLLA